MFNNNNLTNNKHITLASHENQHWLFSLVELMLCGIKLLDYFMVGL